MVRDQDAAEMKRIAEALKSEGWTHASASFVHRAACVVQGRVHRGDGACGKLRRIDRRMQFGVQPQVDTERRATAHLAKLANLRAEIVGRDVEPGENAEPAGA